CQYYGTINATGFYTFTPDSAGAGPYNITIKVNDSKTQTIAYLYLNVTAPVNHVPVIQAIPSLNGVIGVPITYQVVATDADGDTLTYSCQYYGTINATGFYTFTPDSAGAGPYNITIKVNDSKTQTIAYLYLNVTASANQQPTVVIISPSNGATVSGTVMVSGTANDIDGAVQSVEIKINDGIWYNAAGTQSWSYSFDTTNLPSGNATIYAKAFDGTEYSAPTTITVKINKLPVVTIDSPANNAVVSGKITVSGSANDADGGVQSVEVRVDNDSWKSAKFKDGQWSYDIDTTKLSNGEHGIYVRAYDGNSSSLDSIIKIKVDNKKESKGFIPGFEILALISILGVSALLKRRRIKLA
ncbi:MAG: Ig-like domain-containing protein, partial [Thermoplasmata archaeon]